MNTITLNEDNKQSQSLESGLQDHHVWYEVYRNIYHQGLGTF